MSPFVSVPLVRPSRRKNTTTHTHKRTKVGRTVGAGGDESHVRGARADADRGGGHVGVVGPGGAHGGAQGGGEDESGLHCVCGWDVCVDLYSSTVCTVATVLMLPCRVILYVAVYSMIKIFLDLNLNLRSSSCSDVL